MSLIKQPSDVIYITTVKALIYGQPGLGKTTFGLTSPQPLLLDFDRGIRRVQVQHRKPFVDITNWQDVMGLLNEDLSAYRSLVLDTAGKALDALAMTIMQENPKLAYQGSLTQQGYGVLKIRFSDFVRQVSAMGKNLIFIAHDKENRDGDSTSIRPDISGGSMATLIREMDLVGYMQSLNNKRTISFNPSDRYYGKNTCNIPNIIEIEELGGTRKNASGKDETIDMDNMLMSIGNIISMFQHQQNRQNEVAADYNLLLEVIREKVDNIQDPETASMVVEEIGKLNHLWGSKAQAGTWIKARMKELNMSYKVDRGYYYLETPAPAPAAPAPEGSSEPATVNTNNVKPDGTDKPKPTKKSPAPKAKVQAQPNAS